MLNPIFKKHPLDTIEGWDVAVQEMGDGSFLLTTDKAGIVRIKQYIHRWWKNTFDLSVIHRDYHQLSYSVYLIDRDVEAMLKSFEVS